MVQLTLPKALIASMLVVHDDLRGAFVEALRSTEEADVKEDARAVAPSVDAVMTGRGAKYCGEILGQKLAASTLPMLLGQFVDQMACVAPEALEEFSYRRSRKRRFVARRWEAVHPGRPDLGVLQTNSGWWVSSNIGKKDLIRALKELALSAGLQFDKDVRFPVRGLLLFG
jgi:hypothetical protein